MTEETKPASRWLITNTISGHVFGVYAGKDEAAALDAMARHAGYLDFADACGSAPIEDDILGGKIQVEQVPAFSAADVIEWSNWPDAEIDAEGDIWANGHWLDAEELAIFARWLIDREAAPRAPSVGSNA